MFSSTMPMQTEWFRQKLADRKLSQRQLAKLMGLDPAAISLMFRDQRKMTNEEAHFIASTIGVPVTEVLRRAGIEVLDDVRAVPISASMDDACAITIFPDKTHDKVHGPADCPVGTYAVQVRAPTSVQDGWLVFVAPAQQQPNELLDRLCLVTFAKGVQTIGVIKRGYRSGTFNVVRLLTRDVLQDKTIAWASPVLWVKPT